MNHIEVTKVIGLLAGFFTTVALVPQIIKAVRTSKVEGVSPFFFTVLILGVGLWTVYGILKKDWPIIITNGISFLLNLTMLIIYYNKN